MAKLTSDAATPARRAEAIAGRLPPLLVAAERVVLFEESRSVAGSAGLDRLATTLVAEKSEEASLPPWISLPRHAKVVLLSDFLSPLDEIQAVVSRLAGIPVTSYLLQVLDPAETLLPYEGRVRFRGLEREPDTLIPRVENIREAYAQRLQAQQAGLAAICRAVGFGFGIHRTDHSPETALLTLYMALGAR